MTAEQLSYEQIRATIAPLSRDDLEGLLHYLAGWAPEAFVNASKTVQAHPAPLPETPAECSSCGATSDLVACHDTGAGDDGSVLWYCDNREACQARRIARNVTVKVAGFPEKCRYPFREILADGGVWKLDPATFKAKPGSVYAAARKWAGEHGVAVKAMQDGGLVYVQFTRGRTS